MKAGEIKAYLGNDWEKTMAAMRESLSTNVRLLQSVNDSILLHSGKMFRPVLCLLMSRVCGGGKASADSVKYAAAVELLHNATLLHDDVADEADERRGVPTVASVYGPAPAVLVGDFWLSRAVDLILDVKDYTWATRAFAKTITDLSEGEMLQQQKALTGDTSEEDYLRIIYDKTASLFELSCMSAAKSVEASEEYFAAAKAYGKALGIAFQIKDDILDYDGANLGKPTGLDILERKITLPLLGALKDSDKEEEIREMIRFIPSHPENSTIISNFVHTGGGVDYAEKRLQDFVDEAIAQLAAFPDSPEKDYLVEVARFTALRNR